ncbi:uncharacterized protein V6R79_007916 [Siganus canaliculatus]
MKSGHASPTDTQRSTSVIVIHDKTNNSDGLDTSRNAADTRLKKQRSICLDTAQTGEGCLEKADSVQFWMIYSGYRTVLHR